MRREVGGKKPAVEYLEKNKELLDTLVKGYENPDVALICGQLLRQCIEHESLAKILLHSSLFNNFFGYVELGGFDVASDAFTTFKVAPQNCDVQEIHINHHKRDVNAS